MDTFNKDLIAALDLAVLENKAGENYSFLGPVPQWFRLLYPEMVDPKKPIKPGRKFVFLVHFLEDAEIFWKASDTGRLKSGAWTEVDTKGQEHQLEATAINLNGKKVLLLECGRYSYKEKQFILSSSSAYSFDYKLLEAFEEHEKQIRADAREKMLAEYQELKDENARLKQRIADLEKNRP